MATVSEIIARHGDAILRGWTDEVRTIPAARGLSPYELTDKIARYLGALGDLEDSSGDRRRLLTNHLSARLREGYELRDVVDELTFLARGVEHAASIDSDGGRVDAAELARLRAALREDAGVAIEAITLYLVNDAQQEKQYQRRLQSLAGDVPLGGGEGSSMKGVLREVLDLVMEAVGAQTSAILFHDREREALWVAASAGLVEEPLLRYVTDDLSSFVAAIAARKGETTAVLDVETTELEVSASLRQSGIHSLLGVRLPARHALVGVMYVGMTERRAFSLKEVQRLESLGAQLSQHFDQARLNAELKATVEDLRIEQVLRERFISVLAHDLRNPLSVIRSAVYILGKRAEDLGEYRELPGRALRNVLRADAMIRDLLDVLRIRAGNELPLTLDECDLVGVARAACADLGGVHGDRFVLRCDADVRGTWSGDALHRAIWNLGANAVKFGDPETPIEIAVRALDAGAEIAVHNLGPVIEEADRATLFRPFTQRNAEPGGNAQGWGLGLTLVQSCATAHGGSVEVTSTATEGTTFTMKIPYDSRPFQPEASSP